MQKAAKKAAYIPSHETAQLTFTAEAPVYRRVN